MKGIVVLATLLLFVLSATKTQASCDLDEMGSGCRIRNAQCSCGYGCRSEFRYESRDECQQALRGKRENECYPGKCLHGGTCLQITSYPKFKCLCEGTGYYGTNCDIPCPGRGSRHQRNFPYECVVI